MKKLKKLLSHVLALALSAFCFLPSAIQAQGDPLCGKISNVIDMPASVLRDNGDYVVCPFDIHNRWGLPKNEDFRFTENDVEDDLKKAIPQWERDHVYRDLLVQYSWQYSDDGSHWKGMNGPHAKCGTHYYRRLVSVSWGYHWDRKGCQAVPSNAIKLTVLCDPGPLTPSRQYIDAGEAAEKLVSPDPITHPSLTVDYQWEEDDRGHTFCGYNWKEGYRRIGHTGRDYDYVGSKTKRFRRTVRWSKGGQLYCLSPYKEAEVWVRHPVSIYFLNHDKFCKGSELTLLQASLFDEVAHYSGGDGDLLRLYYSSAQKPPVADGQNGLMFQSSSSVMMMVVITSV